MPTFVTHILDVRDGTASTMHVPFLGFPDPHPKNIEEKVGKTSKVGGLVVNMKDVNVTYGTRKVTEYNFKKHYSHDSF